MSKKKNARSIISIIPVRGSDKEFQHGKFPLLAGKSLLSYTIDASLESSLIDRTIVTTDSKEISRIASECGAETPFLRPTDLSKDGVTVTDVLAHTISWLEEKEGIELEAVVLLEITHPFRPPGLIDEVISIFKSKELDSAFAAAEENHNFWFIDSKGDPKLIGEVQDEKSGSFKQQIYREMRGLITVSKPSVIREGLHLGKNVGLIPVRGIEGNVDTHSKIGMPLAEILLKRSKKRRQ